MATINHRTLIRNFSSLGLVQGINALIQLLLVPLVISRIGVDYYGQIAVIQVIVFFLATLAEYGYGQTGARDVALNRNNKTVLAELFYNSLYTNSAALPCSLIFPVIRLQFSLYCLAFVFVPGQASLPSWFLQGMEKLQWAALISLFSKILFAIAVVLFIHDPAHTGLFTLFLGLGNLATGVIASMWLIRYYQLPAVPFSMQKVIISLKEGWPVTVSNLLMNFMQYGNLFILRLFTNDLIAGYFSVAERIYFSMKQLLTAFSQTIYPSVCQSALEGRESLQQYFRKIFTPFWLLTIAGSAIVALFAPFITRFFVQERQEDAIFYLRILCVILPVVCFNIPGSLSLLATNHLKKYFIIYTVGFMLGTLANIILVPLWMAHGTLFAIGITELFITIAVSLALCSLPDKNSISAQPRH
jgi:PST family polysaccharide transporter